MKFEGRPQGQTRYKWSTVEQKGAPKYWWKLPNSEAERAKVPIGLYIVHDRPNHWSWEPATRMSLSAYQLLLLSSEVNFERDFLGGDKNEN